MINVLATINLKPGTRAEFLKIFNANVPAVLAENGCVEYYPAIDVDAKLDAQSKDENAVVVIEKWETLEALHAHLKAPHMVEFRKNAGDMIVGMELKVLKHG
ncbi:antibiotic biosynthesis monooxygenase [Mariniblastus sp.]|nr:antibiotic biosynthesis monooxygenase [Mariniblastus sp.]